MIKDRDINDTNNIDTVGRAHPKPTDACGHDCSVSSFHKFEATSMDETGSEDGY